MITFKSIADLAKLSPADPAHDVIQELLAAFPRDPDIHGYVVLIEPGDTEISLPELKGTIADLCFDGVSKQGVHYIACYLTNNSWGLEVVVPDAPWLPAEIRYSLEAHAEDWPPYLKNQPF